jgi:acetolactate synthase I/II/III large subunit
MTGAESLVHTLLGSGIDVCFANPGTSEMHFVAALDRIPGMRCILGLQENVVTGAADGYWRMAEKPAATLLHCGPGLANGLANLHNARRARSGIVNIVGDQATYHRRLDAPLTADTEGWARGVSAWTRTVTDAATVGRDAAAAVQAARQGQIATLILPADTAWNPNGSAGEALPVPSTPRAAPSAIESAARALRSGQPTLLLLGGASLRGIALANAHRIAVATGARIMAQMFNARIERGRGRPPVTRVSYPVDRALAELAEFKHLILVGATPPVSFFAYPGKPGKLYPPECEVHVLARPEQDAPSALEQLADALQPPIVPPIDAGVRGEPARGAATFAAVAQTIAALLPENAIVVNEGGTCGPGIFSASHCAAPHDWLDLMGGAIGAGPPMAVGAAIGAPGRRVVALQADGSGMYTVQALWTQARERLDVTTVVFSNRTYAILLGELANVGAKAGPAALSMMSLSDPDIGWTHLAIGLGVEAARAESCEQLADLLRASFNRSGPFLIELCISGPRLIQAAD